MVLSDDEDRLASECLAGVQIPLVPDRGAVTLLSMAWSDDGGAASLVLVSFFGPPAVLDGVSMVLGCIKLGMDRGLLECD